MLAETILYDRIIQELVRILPSLASGSTIFLSKVIGVIIRVAMELVEGLKLDVKRKLQGHEKKNIVIVLIRRLLHEITGGHILSDLGIVPDMPPTQENLNAISSSIDTICSASKGRIKVNKKRNILTHFK